MNIRLWPWALLGLALVPALLITIPKPHVVEPSPAQTTLVEVIWAMPHNLDPALASTPADWQVDDNVFEPLLSETSAGQVVPGAASLVTFQGHTVTVVVGSHKLANNRSLTASTVEEALARPLLPTVNSPVARVLLRNVVGYRSVISGHQNYLSGIRVVSKNTLTITLKTPASLGFLRNLANPALSIVPLSDQVQGGPNWQFTNLVGTGGYRLTNWVPLDHLSFQRVTGSGPTRVDLELYSSFHLALLGFINKTVTVLPVPANQLAAMPTRLSRQVTFLPTPGTLSLFWGAKSPHASTYPVKAPVSQWVDRAFAGRVSALGYSWPSGMPAGHPMTVWVNGQDTAAVVLARSLAHLTAGKVSVRVSSASQIRALASSGQIAAYIGTQNWFKAGKTLPLMHRGNFWLWNQDVLSATSFANGALNWHSITFRG